MNATRVGVFGMNGKMGSQVVQAVKQDEGLRFTGGSDIDQPRDAIGDAQVVVDFTHPDAVMDNIEWAVCHGLDVVVGTTGFTDERLQRVQQLCDEHPEVGVLIASNFSIGANLMMRFSELAAKYYPSAEIVELHHTNKADAPSGTSATTAKRIAAARAAANMGPVPDATVHDELGARGAVVDGIHIHGLRIQGLVAHQEVHFGAPGENLTIRHDSFDRESFMPGVLAAIGYVREHKGLTVGLTEVLGI